MHLSVLCNTRFNIFHFLIWFLLFDPALFRKSYLICIYLFNLSFIYLICILFLFILFLFISFSCSKRTYAWLRSTVMSVNCQLKSSVSMQESHPRVHWGRGGAFRQEAQEKPSAW